MRIIAGSARGRILKSFKGPGVRPTTDRVRESWFAALGARVVGSRFLDLYAGTGAVGIEALSRGAARAVLVEKSRQGVAVIRENLRVLGELPEGAVLVRQGDAVQAVAVLEHAGEVLIWSADPPYGIWRHRRRCWLPWETRGAFAADALVTSSTRGASPSEEAAAWSCARNACMGPTLRGYGWGQSGDLPGTFDPITNGHLDVIERAARASSRGHRRGCSQPGKAPLLRDGRASRSGRAPTISQMWRWLPFQAAGEPVPDGSAGGVKGLRGV